MQPNGTSTSDPGSSRLQLFDQHPWQEGLNLVVEPVAGAGLFVFNGRWLALPVEFDQIDIALTHPVVARLNTVGERLTCLFLIDFPSGCGPVDA